MNVEEYEREGRVAYAAFATTVASILAAAISAEGGYRLQQVKERAKQPASLRKKLEGRGIAATETLENDIKDLAGCRVIFYTNGDVTQFIGSGIINQNFEVLEVKIHHPKREAEDAAELYISNHYLVRLKPERIALPEYACFAGMRCEIQIQTILNHAWAEMAHDTIYKAPTLGSFGGRAFDGITSRMQKVARKYLLPAGYEFQKIASDFQRLIEGKALFDGDALEAIVEAADNNIRAAALETFAENVLPLYDDIQAVYPEVITRLVAAAERARSIQPFVIETPYGALPAKTYSDIGEAIAGILTSYRYLDVEGTFNALCSLYGWAEEERKPFLELGKALARQELHIWRERGPIVQAKLVDLIEAIGEDDRRSLHLLLTTMLGEVLGTEVSGTTHGSVSVTLHRGAVVASEALEKVREKAIGLLKQQFTLAESDEERGTVLLALHAATRTPVSVPYDNPLARLVADDTRKVLDFYTETAPMLPLGLLQSVEERVHRCYWRYAELPEKMREDADLVAVASSVQAAAYAFRDVANANPDFVTYKTLVGFNSVFPPAWVEREFDRKQAAAYRAEQVDALLASVEDATTDAWFNRVSNYARTESNDAATFPVFGDFLERLAESKPGIVLDYINRLEEPLANFLPRMLSGVMRSTERTQALALIDAWLHSGDYVRHIAWYLRFADPFDEGLLRRVLDSAIEHGDRHAVRNVLIASVQQFSAHPGSLVESIFLPALHYLVAGSDFSWVRMPWFSWLGSPIIRALDEEQANTVLDALVSYPELDGDSEHIAAAIAERWPSSVVAFIGKRQEFAQTDVAPHRYDAVPFGVYELKTPLAADPHILLDGARTWFEANPQHFTYDGARLIASVFPDLGEGLEAYLSVLIGGGNPSDLAFVLGVLSAFEGKPCIYGLVREIVAALDTESPLLREVQAALNESGVVSGEFGYAKLHAGRKALLEEWLADPNDRVRKFAGEEIRILERQIAAENRAAEASIALRKLDYGEELGPPGNDA